MLRSFFAVFRVLSWSNRHPNATGCPSNLTRDVQDICTGRGTIFNGNLWYTLSSNKSDHHWVACGNILSFLISTDKMERLQPTCFPNYIVIRHRQGVRFGSTTLSDHSYHKLGTFKVRIEKKAKYAMNLQDNKWNLGNIFWTHYTITLHFITVRVLGIFKK